MHNVQMTLGSWEPIKGSYIFCTHIYLIITDCNMEKTCAIVFCYVTSIVNKNCQSIPTYTNMKSSVLWIWKKKKQTYLLIPVPVPLLNWPTSPLKCSFCFGFNKLVLPPVGPQILLCVPTKNRDPWGRALIDPPYPVTIFKIIHFSENLVVYLWSLLSFHNNIWWKFSLAHEFWYFDFSNLLYT